MSAADFPKVVAAGAKQRGGGADGSELWLRIAAFLSTKSNNTQRTYCGILEQWCSFLGIRFGDPDGVSSFVAANELHAIAYKRWLEGQPGQKPRLVSSVSDGEKQLSRHRRQGNVKDGTQSTLANATISKKFAALRRVYRMLMAAPLDVRANPFATEQVAIASAKSGQKRPTELFPFELVNTILALPDLSKPKGVQDHCVLALLFGGGLRRSEVVKLRMADVRCTSEGTVFVHLRATKAGKDADQALPPWAAEALQLQLETRMEQGAKSGDFLMVGYRGKGGEIPSQQPLSDSCIYRMFKAYCRRAGAGNFVTPHSARAAAITKLLSDGVPHREVQEFSRHSSIQMVEVYDKRRYGIDKNPAKDLKY